MPQREDARDVERAPFAYATIRVVPRVEREEFVNVGVVLFSRPRKFLGVQARLDRDRLLALWPELDLDAVERQLAVMRLVVAGDPAGGAIARLPAAERFGWLSAPASTIVQPGPVHAGLAAVMSIAAAPLVASRSGNSGSDHVPDLRILPGRYITALMPSIGLMPTLLHCPVARSSVRVMRSGPASNSLPSGSTKRNG